MRLCPNFRVRSFIINVKAVQIGRKMMMAIFLGAFLAQWSFQSQSNRQRIDICGVVPRQNWSSPPSDYMYFKISFIFVLFHHLRKFTVFLIDQGPPLHFDVGGNSILLPRARSKNITVTVNTWWRSSCGLRSLLKLHFIFGWAPCARVYLTWGDSP